MKSILEQQFDRVIAEGFYALLKPLGFKRKARNFYLQLEDLGHIISIQRSTRGTRASIIFTISVGIFIPAYWKVHLDHNKNSVPEYPSETACLIRTRIGPLLGKSDTWYELTSDMDVESIISEMRTNVSDYILPYLHRFNSNEKMLQELDGTDLMAPRLGKLITYAEFGRTEEAKQVYMQLLAEASNPQFLRTIKKYGDTYGLAK